jgi:hypothetical protein
MWTAQSFAEEKNGKTPLSLSVSTLQDWRAFQVILVEKFYRSMEKHVMFFPEIVMQL